MDANNLTISKPSKLRVRSSTSIGHAKSTMSGGHHFPMAKSTMQSISSAKVWVMGVKSLLRISSKISLMNVFEMPARATETVNAVHGELGAECNQDG